MVKISYILIIISGMCTRPSELRPRQDPKPISPRPRQNRDVQNFFRDETETIRLNLRWDRDETLQLPRCWPRPWSFRDSRESRELQRLAETFFVTYGETHWQWKQIIQVN